MSFIDVAELEFTSKKCCFISIPKSWHIRSTNVCFDTYLEVFPNFFFLFSGDPDLQSSVTKKRRRVEGSANELEWRYY